jgi:methionyl-tRNA formyltransferase
LPNLVFMGTPEFAVPALQHLIEANHRISMLVCQPDKKKGRGKRLQFPPTKQLALDRSIEVFQPASVRNPENIDSIASVEPDFIVVVAYGKILPAALLKVPKKGCINIHASLLPAWRGAAPIQFALMNGDEKTGVCTMLMDEGLDTGDILLTKETEILPDEMVDGLSNRLSILGAELIVETLNRFDEIQPIAQDHEAATYSRLINKEDRIINWSKDAGVINGHFKALSPTPGVFTTFRKKRLKINILQIGNFEDRASSIRPGTVVSIDKENFLVACGKGTVSVLAVQPENKNQISARDFVNGYQLKVNDILGEASN